MVVSKGLNEVIVRPGTSHKTCDPCLHPLSQLLGGTAVNSHSDISAGGQLQLHEVAGIRDVQIGIT